MNNTSDGVQGRRPAAGARRATPPTAVRDPDVRLLERKAFFAVLSCVLANPPSDTAPASETPPDHTSLLRRLAKALHVPDHIEPSIEAFDPINASRVFADIPERKRRKRSSTAFVAPDAKVKRLVLGDVVDCKDCSEVWLEAVIREVDVEQERIRVHYTGWNSRFDEWIDLDEPGRLAPKGTHSRRNANGNQSHSRRNGQAP